MYFFTPIDSRYSVQDYNDISQKYIVSSRLITGCHRIIVDH